MSYFNHATSDKVGWGWDIQPAPGNQKEYQFPGEGLAGNVQVGREWGPSAVCKHPHHTFHDKRQARLWADQSDGGVMTVPGCLVPALGDWVRTVALSVALKTKWLAMYLPKLLPRAPNGIKRAL